MNAPLNPRFSVTPGHRSRKPFIGLFLVGLVPALVACAEVINHAEMPESHGLTVVGTGQAVADPDVAIANVGVEVRDANPQRAVELNNKQMSLLVTNLKALGIQDPDLQTTNFSISYERPQVDYRREPAPPPKPTPAPDEPTRTDAAATPAQSEPDGWFVVNNTLRVKVRDLNRLGDVLSTATTAGANSIWGVELQLDKPDPLLAQARDKAVEDALTKAQRLAQISGVKLGRIVSIEEHGGGSPRPQAAGMLFARDAKSSVPIEAGSLELSASVTVRFTLESGNAPAPATAAPANP